MELTTFYWRQFALTALLLLGGVLLIRFRSKRKSLSVLGIGVAVCCFLLFPAALLIDGCDYNGSMHTAILVSPNGQYVSRAVIWRGSALDIDYARVIVRRPYSPFWKTVYEGNWFGDEDGSPTPHIRWENDKRLVIEVPGEYFSTDQCASSAGNVVIECKPQHTP